MTTCSPWAVLFALCVGQSLGLLNSTSVNVALPAIGTGLNASLGQLLWVVNVYILVLTALLMVGARLGDLFSPKRMYLVGLAVFTAASAVCGAAQNPTQLVAARVVQAAGSAMMSPQTLSLITKVFPANRRGAAIGVWGSFSGVSVAVAPTLGGLLVSTLDWRWVFLVNVPIGLVGLLLAAIVVPDVPSARSRRLDLVGIGLLTVSLFLIAYGLIEGEPNRWGAVWGPVTVPMIVAAGVLGLVVFAVVERGRQHGDPLLPFAVLRTRNFVLMAGVTATIACGIGTVFIVVFLHLQSGVGMTALAAGLAVAVAPVVSTVVSPVSGRLTDRFGGKYVLLTGLAVCAAGVAMLAGVTRVDVSWQGLLPAMVVLGIGMGVVFSPGGAIAMRDVDSALSGAASGLLSLSRMIGSALGAALVGMMLQADLAASGSAGAGLADLPPQAVTDAVRFVYLLPIGVFVIGMLLSLAAYHQRGEPGSAPAGVNAAGLRLVGQPDDST